MSAPEEVVLLMRTWNDGEAEIVRNLLESYGIPCQVVSDITHSVLPLSIDGLGEITIFVPRSAFEEASDLLAQHRRNGLEGLPGGAAGEPEDGDSDGPGAESDEPPGFGRQGSE